MEMLVKVWFQNRRMKHKRQTLGKQGEDGDDKDSVTSESSRSAKLSDKFLEEDISKKSCQGCEMPATGICGSNEEFPDIKTNKGNDKNTPSETNNNISNNNNNFSNNSNTSSIDSSASHDKLMNEGDSRSNEESGSSKTSKIPKNSPVLSNTTVLKVEGRRNSPIATCEKKAGMKKVSASPSLSKDSGISFGSNESISIKMSPISSSGIPTNLLYPHHRQSSSPTTATAIASATVTIQNGNMPIAHFPDQFNSNNQTEYRAQNRQKHYQMSQIYTGHMYSQNHPAVNSAQDYHGSHPNNMGHHNPTRFPGKGRQSNYSAHANQYFYKHSGCDDYTIGSNIYGQVHHAGENGYHHYGYSGNNVYPNDGNETMAQMPNSVCHNQDLTSDYYDSENMIPVSTRLQNQPEYPNRVGYYDSTYSSSNVTQNADTTYVSTEIFPGDNSTSIMTPPASCATEGSENHNFHQFYPGETQTQVAVPAESSNSSSDFNFLSSLANDYTPEYYQI
ncbi:unnamed protein product [Phaedon cochleariae]|uniref:Homeobox domain-containing protein n=1 Tax=Phaedon cochleariae TaxID=80249 RepID=A0A9P0GW85_PHACE|nr:unnamed protein product [Phaedon cochleariae]